MYAFFSSIIWGYVVDTSKQTPLYVMETAHVIVTNHSSNIYMAATNISHLFLR